MIQAPKIHPSVTISSPERGSRFQNFLRRNKGWVLGLSLSATLLSVAGCAWRMPFTNREIVSHLPETPSLDQLLEHLNANTAKMTAWKSTDVKIRTRGPMGMPISLGATLAVEQPRNLRVVAHSLAGNEVDLGSNEDQFWFWMRRAEPQRLFTCRHDRIHIARQRLPIPFQPDWVIEATGVIPINPTEVALELDPDHPQRARLIRHRTDPSGDPVRMVTVIDVRRGVVIEHHLWDARGRAIAHATLTNHRLDQDSGAVVPHMIELDWPQEKLGLTIELSAVEVNPGNLSAAMFDAPTIEGFPELDLGKPTSPHRGGVSQDPF